MKLAEKLLNLDFATLFKWFELEKAFPDYFTDHEVIVKRFEAANQTKRPDLARQPQPFGERQVRNFAAAIRCGGEKPLTKQFDGIDPKRIRTLIPLMRANDKYAQGFFEADGAAFGYAPSAHRPDMPFTFGFYQSDARKHGVKRSIAKDEIIPGKFKIYKLGTIQLTPKSQIWFGRSWGTKAELNDLWEPGEDNEWEAYASLNFQGPKYGGNPVEGLRSGEKDLVLCDRVILVRKEEENGKDAAGE